MSYHWSNGISVCVWRQADFNSFACDRNVVMTNKMPFCKKCNENALRNEGQRYFQTAGQRGKWNRFVL